MTALVPMRAHTLEAKAKRLHVARSWRDTVGLTKRLDLAAELEKIRTYIVSDRSLPERFYRKDRATTPDRLLEREAIMHLHLGHPGTNELLFLVQYPNDVVLLELSNHHHFASEPPGTLLNQLHRSKLKQWEADRATEIEAFRQKIRAGLLVKPATPEGSGPG